jgi:hypothetical protein
MPVETFGSDGNADAEGAGARLPLIALVLTPLQ